MPAQVEMTLSQGEFKVAVGASVAATATVRNTGTVVDQYTMAVERLDPAWWSVLPATVSLFPGDEATVALTLHPPAEAAAGAHPFLLRVTSVDDGGRSASAEATLHVAPAGELGLSLEPSVFVGREGNYAARLSNRANSEARLTLFGKDPEEALEYRFEPAALTVPAFGESEVSVVVRPQVRRLWGQLKTFQFTLQAIAEGEEEATAVTDGELHYRPFIGGIALPVGRWRWLLALIPLLALALLVRSALQVTPTPTATASPTVPATVASKPSGGGAGQVAAPTIERFEVVRDAAGFGLAWKTQGADKVELGGKPVGKVGKAPIPEAKDQGFELKASNEGGTVTKRINLLVFPPPVVKTFEADPPTVEAGRTTTLRWAVVGAERAKIGDQELRIPDGTLEVRPEASRDYVLTAANGVGWVVQRVYVRVTFPTPTPIPTP